LNTDQFEQWMSEAESDMACRLEKVNLAVRAGFNESEVHRLQGFYGIAAKRNRLRRRPVAEFIAQYPAITVTVLVGHAALAYEQGRYWASFWDEIGYPHTLAFENALRDSVEPNLERFGLDTFPHLHGRYVQTLGVHAGIPIHCMDNLIDVAATYLHRGKDASGAGLADWIQRSEKNADALALAKPVRYFLDYGGAFAIEILDRIVRGLVDPDGGWDRSDDADIELPPITVEGIRAALNVVRSPRLLSSKESDVVRRPGIPALAYSFESGRVVVDLPPTPADDELWSLSVDGETTMVKPDPRWGVEWFEAPSTQVTVQRPAREIVVEESSSGRVRSIAVVDPDDPVLLFDKGVGDGVGKCANARASLPKSEVLVVHPIGATLVDHVSGTVIEPYADLGAPTGWAGWRAGWVDLSGCESFRVETSNVEGTLRGVRIVEIPRLVTHDRLIGVTTSSGIEVVGCRPRLWLPGRSSGTESTWHVRVRTDRGAVLTESDHSTGSDGVEIDPFARVGSPIVGIVTISATGSAGSSAEFTIFVLEGVRVELDRWVRPLAPGGGLREVTAQFSSSHGVRIVEPTVKFTSSDIRCSVVVESDLRTHTLYLTPPHVRTHVGEPEQAIQWKSSVHVLLHADLETSKLVLSVPGCTTLRVDAVDRDGTSLKWYIAKRRDVDQFEVDLRVFYDVLREAGDGELNAVALSADNTLERFTVATIRPVGTCESIRIDDGHMVFDGLRVVDDLVADVWWTTAPWAGSIELPVTDNRVRLPKALKDAGDLLVTLRVADPWVRHDVPVWPDGSAVEVIQNGYRKDRNKGRERLSRYLVDGGRAPSSEKTMPEIWAVLARTLDDMGDVHSSQTRRELLRVVSRNPRAALETLGNSTIPLLQLPSLAVETEIVRQSFRAEETLNDLHTNPWVGAMVEIADLPSLFARRREVMQERSDTLRYLETYGGDNLASILRSGSLPSTARPRHEIVRDIIMLGDETIEGFATALRSVPSALLSAESMCSAYFEAFDVRREWVGVDAPGGILADAQHLAESVDEEYHHLRAIVDERLALATGVFDAGKEWTAIPAFTLVAAALARLEAHGLVSDALFPGPVETWGRIAARCPTLVTTDLLLTEAIVTHHVHGDLIGERSRSV